MKRNVFTFSVILALVLAATLAAAPGMGPRHHGPAGPGGVELAKRIGSLLALADRLEISDDQLIRLRHIFREQREQGKEVRNRLKELGKELHQAMESGHLEQISILAPELGELEGRKVVLRLQFIVQIRQTLSEAQWEKIKVLQMKKFLKKLHNKLKNKNGNHGNRMGKPNFPPMAEKAHNFIRKMMQKRRGQRLQKMFNEKRDGPNRFESGEPQEQPQ